MNSSHIVPLVVTWPIHTAGYHSTSEGMFRVTGLFFLTNYLFGGGRQCLCSGRSLTAYRDQWWMQSWSGGLYHWWLSRVSRNEGRRVWRIVQQRRLRRLFLYKVGRCLLLKCRGLWLLIWCHSHRIKVTLWWNLPQLSGRGGYCC